jgi:hypothetical protein
MSTFQKRFDLYFFTGILQLFSVLQGRVPLVILYISWSLTFFAQQLNDSNRRISLVDLGIWQRQ